MGLPARGYSWADAAPGNVLALKHGARSRRVFEPVARELAAELLVQRPDLENYPDAVTQWAEARAELLRRWIADRTLFDEDEAPRAGVLTWLRTFEGQAAEARKALGLDPRSHADLIKVRAEATSQTFDLEALMARGREAHLAAEQRRTLDASTAESSAGGSVHTTTDGEGEVPQASPSLQPGFGSGPGLSVILLPPVHTRSALLRRQRVWQSFCRLSSTGLYCSVVGAPTVSEVIGKQVQQARKRRHWTQERLAREVKDHGGALDRAAIAKIESGVRSVSIDEYLLLAAVLNVAPPLLLLPLGSENLIEITSRSRIDPHLALEWLRGDEPLTATNRRYIDRPGWLEGSEPIRLWLELRRKEEDVGEALSAVQCADYSNDAVQVRAGRQQHIDALQALHGHLRAMRSAGELVPGQARETLDAMGVIGLDVEDLPVFEPDWTLEEPAGMQTGEA